MTFYFFEWVILTIGWARATAKTAASTKKTCNRIKIFKENINQMQNAVHMYKRNTLKLQKHSKMGLISSISRTLSYYCFNIILLFIFWILNHFKLICRKAIVFNDDKYSFIFQNKINTYHFTSNVCSHMCNFIKFSRQERSWSLKNFVDTIYELSWILNIFLRVKTLTCINF